MDHKKSVAAALKKYHAKQLGQQSTPARKKYKSPEKEVQKDVMAWARENIVFLHIVEASSWDPVVQRRTLSRAERGFSDLVGNTESGHAVYIELKAKDRRSKLSEIQRIFLTRKINQGCFAVVVDSRERLEEYWSHYWSLESLADRARYLIDSLPKQRAKSRDDDHLFPSEE